MMNYSSIKYFDISNGPGCRTSLFVSGCTHRCKGCFNKETWDFGSGERYTEEVEGEIISSLSPDYITGLSILGGEPMEAANQPAVAGLVKKVREVYRDKSIWIYSGYTFEELLDKENKRCHGEHTAEILENIDVLVDGRFVEELKDIRLNFRGSSNQRIIDVKESLACGEIVPDMHM